jgi:hypothetical protein
MKSGKIIAASVLIGLFFTSCTSYQRCEAYSYNDEPVEKKQIYQSTEDSMLDLEIEMTYTNS